MRDIVNPFVEVVEQRFPGVYKPAGYSESEMLDVEALFDIDVSSQLKYFLAGVGRTAGVLHKIIPLHEPKWNIRDHFINQFAYKDMTFQDNIFDLWDHAPFFIFNILETHHYGLRTRGVDCVDELFLYDEAGGSLEYTNVSLLDFFKSEVEKVKAPGNQMPQADIFKFR